MSLFYPQKNSWKSSYNGKECAAAAGANFSAAAPVGFKIGSYFREGAPPFGFAVLVLRSFLLYYPEPCLRYCFAAMPLIHPRHALCI
ncbi:hypothetical protein KJ652_03355, partial [Patescibacteria group bacterium]|nr:hypothetical protein [Patescibacteria group bacterium]